MTEPKTESLRVVVTSKMREAVKTAAQINDVSEAQVIRAAIRSYLKVQA